MGGDFGPRVTVSALLTFLSHHQQVTALVYGDERELAGHLSQCRDSAVRSRFQVRHTPSQVDDSDKPSSVLRNKRGSSMALAMQALSENEAEAFVSAGNTGAIMALGLFTLKALPGISRPAICTAIPTANGRSYVLDLGANLDCSAEQLCEFALLGSLMASELDGIASPTVRLLNVGEEANKGRSEIRQAALLLEAEPLINYSGYIEGDGIFKGDCDVVVCDGFVGNVALKTSEGLVKMVGNQFRQAVGNGWLARIALILLQRPLRQLRTELDPSLYNGAYVLGLDGVVVKSHGSASKEGFIRALEVAAEAAKHNLPKVLSPILKNKLNRNE